MLRQIATPGCRFVSLQPQLRETDRELLAAWPDALDAGRELRDFGDTAALIAALDLVISVDTGVAHLAGALGRPVWLLLPHVPDWRWLLDRDSSPWYPSARLYRQKAAGDWPALLARVRTDLQARVGGRGVVDNPAP
jgi:ADP-heptose:LPS heptosyltransferase